MGKYLGAIIGLALCLGGCGFLPPSQLQEFAVNGEIPPRPAPATGFHNPDTQINQTLAANICADGYENLGVSTLPAQDDGRDQEAYTRWRVRCADYFPHLF